MSAAVPHPTVDQDRAVSRCLMKLRTAEAMELLVGAVYGRSSSPTTHCLRSGR